MSMAPRSRHLVVFLKAPRLGQVKSRLAADIGALAALNFYRETSARLRRCLGRDRRWRLWLAVTPRAALAARFWDARLVRREGESLATAWAACSASCRRGRW
jgi:hypothetical protein